MSDLSSDPSAIRMRNWRKANPSKSRLAVKNYRRKNAKKCRAISRAWRRDNPDKARAAVEAWRMNNPDKVRKMRDKWYRRNKQYTLLQRRQRYARERTTLRQQAKENRFKLKLQLVALLGGKCIDCGYNKHPAALEFHHCNGKKEKAISVLMNGSKKERLHSELKKCVLICANCHNIRHYAFKPS